MPKKPASTKLIDSIAELLDNVRRFATTESPEKIRKHRLAMLSRGRNLVWLRTDNASMIAPSRFVGYKGAQPKEYLNPNGRDGTETTPEIDRLMRGDGIRRLHQPDGRAWQEAEAEYIQQCKIAGVEPSGKSRS